MRSMTNRNKKRKAPWNRSDKIGFASFLVAIAAIGFSMITPEVRKLTGLEQSDPLSVPSPVILKSDYGADYSKLQYLLASKQFQEADIETTRLLLWAARREKQGVLNTESIKRFSCIDLRTIDNLWRQYSNQRFGFSVQMRMWQKMKHKDPEEFASQIGWINDNENWVKYNDLIFDLRAPIGHLPTAGAFAPSGNLKRNWFSILFNQCF
jgi:hypothetical protein